MKTKNTTEYQAGRLRPIVQVVARLVKENPEMADNMGFLWANVQSIIPELKDRSKCANCGESMAVYTYTVTYLDTKLLCAMAEIITKRMNKGMSFTDANKIHLQTEIPNYTLTSRQTIASKLGLIAKVMREGKHNRRLGWSITKRGFEFLRGQPVPRQVKVFHNTIQARFEETITMIDTLSQANSMSEKRELQDIAGVFIDSYEQPRLL